MSTPDPISEFSCRECGACCRTAHDGRILITPEDLVRWRRQNATQMLEGLAPGHFGLPGFASRPDGSCIHLGTEGRPNDCSVYEIRADVCREFEAGSPQCISYRRERFPSP